MKEKFFFTLNCLLIAFFIVWPLGWLITGAYYSHPNAEDLSLSLLPRDHGTLESIANMLVTYDGRYFTNLLHAVNPLVLNSITGFKWMPVAGISLLVLSFWFFLITFFKGVSKLKLLIFSLLFTVLHFALAPSLPHDLYWLVSSYVYLYPWSFTFLWISAYARFIHSVKSGHSFMWFLATITFLVCCIGMNEMFLVTNSLLLFFITYRSYRQNKDAFNKTLPVVIAGIACILFFVSCPGILFRMEANIPTDKSLLNIQGILQSLSDYPYTLVNLLDNGLLLSASFLILFFIKDVQFRYPDFTGLNNSRNVLSAMAICMIAAYLMSLAYYLPMQVDSGYPSRIFNSVIILQELVILILLPVLLHHHSTIKRITSSTFIQKIGIPAILIIIIVQLLRSENNISLMRTEYNEGRFEALDETMNNRYSKIEAAKITRGCLHIAVVDSLINPPATIYHGPDISRNRKVNYWNMAYESYFGIDEIKIEGDSLLF